jgi:AmpD protein
MPLEVPRAGLDSALAIDPASGLLRGVRFMPSPNVDDRPVGMPVDAIIIHGISLPPGEFGGPWVDQLFTNGLDPTAHPHFLALAGLRVSAHLFIRRDGEVIQYVPFHRRAWHAGRSHFLGRDRCNDFAIGIELEGTDDTAYTPVQYRRLAAVIACLMASYPGITAERITGHSDVAPGRKTDPGSAFDWPRLRRMLDDKLRPRSAAPPSDPHPSP